MLGRRQGREKETGRGKTGKEEQRATNLGEVQGLANRGQIHDTPRGAHNNVRDLVLQRLDVGLNVDAAVEDAALDVGQVFGESLVLALDLEGQLARVAQDNNVHLACHGGDLVKGGEDEDGRLAHAGLGLADDVKAQHSLRDALVLHLAGVLEATVYDGAQQLGLEHEVAEVARVDGGIVSPNKRRRRRRRRW